MPGLLPKHRYSSLVRGFLLAAVVAAPALAVAAEDTRWFSQKPEVADSSDSGKPLPAGVPNPALEPLKQGPAPQWIWGKDISRRYFLRTNFDGGTKSAAIRAAADDKFTIFLNGRRVASGTAWNTPVDVDITREVRNGKNELIVEVENMAGSPAGLALKLALTGADGKTRYVVSDDSWRAAEARRSRDWAAVQTFGAMGVAPWNDVFAQPIQPPKTAQNIFQVLPGYKVELLYTVPRETLGSWVSITFDDKGRLIASDQETKGLCRITLPPVGSDQETKVEHLKLDITSAQGMLYAFGSLYLSVNGGPGSGVYRARDTDGDDQYDKVEKLASIPGGGEHGPHALRLTPDGKSILIVCGNHTLPPEHISSSLIPTNWGEDMILPRQWDANGHAVGIMAPGGYVAKFDPEGKNWEMVSIGYRNSYDMDHNADGELFVYDSDMEWDFGMPWYRPTRVNHATSGSEFGWRSGTGVWPAYNVDSLPPVTDIGPGSPVGVTFGYGAKFPAKYQKALLMCDWTFGTMYAIHLEPEGSSYKAVKEEFLSRTPLPLTDVAVGPDGALYFSVGGRGTQSELYRVTYTGDESTKPVDARDPRGAELRDLRHKIEVYHRRAEDQAKAVAFALPYLKHEDRFIRYAARIALEQQEPKYWQDQVLAQKDPEALILGAVAVARQGDKSLQPKVLEALDRINFEGLDESRQLDLLRAWDLTFIRMGEPDAATAARLSKKLDPFFPSKLEKVNRELVNLLVYLKSPTVLAKTIALMEKPSEATSVEVSDLIARNENYGEPIAKMIANRPDAQKMHYALALRNVKEGWTVAERKFYFNWLKEAHKWSGGASYHGFVNNIDKEAFENASEAERLVIESSGARSPYRAKDLPKPAGPGKDWTLDELVALTKDPLHGRNFANGQRTFAAARCVVCHRFGGDGGATGPDLTQAAGRFGFKDLSEAIIDPSKVVSDQYRATAIATTSGQVHTGRIVGENKDSITILVDPEDSTKIVVIPRGEIDEMTPSKVSLMPEKLLNNLNKDEVLDLLSYVLSRGNAKDPMFQKK
ncbi:c-type cytochrome [Singulisphaera sp. PoT]|uniref:c-type cytochrome n=1 Tax=Singulisphaera sp. PoT TaxID=3411797 RepID=UPI003BF4CA7C